jgi:hypothetical protein
MPIYIDGSDPSQCFVGTVYLGTTYCGWCLVMVSGTPTDHWCRARKRAARKYARAQRQYRLDIREDGSIDYSNAYVPTVYPEHTIAPPTVTTPPSHSCHCMNCTNKRQW